MRAFDHRSGERMRNDDFNPYSPPTAAIEPMFGGLASEGEVKVWRDGNELVSLVDAPLPPRCVKCNRPVQGRIKPRTFYWHSPWLFLLVLINLLIAIIVVAIVRKKSVHPAALCDAHAKARGQIILGAWATALAAPFIGGGIAAISGDAGGLVGAGVTVLLVLGALVFGSMKGRVMLPRRIDKRIARFTGCGDEFLRSLPTLPVQLRRR